MACVIEPLPQGAAPLRLIDTIPLRNVDGRIDHMVADVRGQRLFVAALGNNTVEVIDLSKGKQTQTIRDLQEPQGVLYLPENNNIFVANAGDGTCKVFDSNSLDLTNTHDFGDDADNLRYDAAARRVYVGYGNGALGIIAAGTPSREGDIRLAGHPESFQLEKTGGRIFVNVPTATQVAVVDREKRAVVGTWSLEGARSNFPMALDEMNRRLLVGTRNPPKLVVLDTDSGKVVASPIIDGDTDDVFYDAQRKRVYVSCGAGFIDVLDQTDADHYDLTVAIPTASGARTSLFVPELSRLYLAVPHRGDQGAEIRIYEAQ